jgi:peptidoglycan/LPS O-acetylase OafA/YrhL
MFCNKGFFSTACNKIVLHSAGRSQFTFSYSRIIGPDLYCPLRKMPPERHTSNHFLPTLDGWRAIAIAMVVLSHSLTTASARGGGGGFLNLLTFRMGTFGVMLFFAISGYLICTRLLVEEETTGSVSLRSFYIRRVFRILPAAYVYLGTVAVLALARILVVGWADIAGAALFYSNYEESGSWFTGHFWSLALEEHFYLLWPPVLVLLGRKRMGRNASGESVRSGDATGSASFPSLHFQLR